MASFIRALAHVLLLAITMLTVAPASAQFSCSASGGGTINFLVYNPASGSPSLASTTVTLTCTHQSGGVQRIDFTMELSSGSSGNCNARTLTGPGTISYNIYQNTIANGVWGNAGCGTFPAGRLQVGPGGGNGTRAATHTLFGQIPTGQFVAAGSYNDALQVTIVYN